MTDERNGLGVVKLVWIVAGLLVAVLAGLHIYLALRPSMRFPTPFQAVLLTNGSVYFGHLHDFGTSHPVLKDVYYIVSRENPKTKEVINTLIKRGKELHEPDRMYLNPNQVVFVETVGPNSKVSQLIAEQEKKK